ncbi:MAG: flagellar motor switch protein FliN [Gammaproteobacteria bacterium]
MANNDPETTNSEPTVPPTTEQAAQETVSPQVEPEIKDPITVKSDTEKDVYLFDPQKLGILNEVSILLTIEVGRAHIKIRDLLNLNKGSVIELNKLAGDPVDVYANGKLISIGNIITANGKYCVRLTSIPESNKLGATVDGK